MKDGNINIFFITGESIAFAGTMSFLYLAELIVVRMKNHMQNPRRREKRAPSTRVTRLADEIMSLTLIEAVDLRDLCQEMARRSADPIPGQVLLPHPMEMFGGEGLPAQPGMAPGMMSGVMLSTPAPQPARLALKAKLATKRKSKAKALPETVSIKLLSFKKGSKTKLVKEVRVVTKLSLKDSKELVEKAPSLIKKCVQREEAEEVKKKFAMVGGEIVLE